jgi:hypothetical protein
MAICFIHSNRVPRAAASESPEPSKSFQRCSFCINSQSPTGFDIDQIPKPKTDVLVRKIVWPFDAHFSKSIVIRNWLGDAAADGGLSLRPARDRETKSEGLSDNAWPRRTRRTRRRFRNLVCLSQIGSRLHRNGFKGHKCRQSSSLVRHPCGST